MEYGGDRQDLTPSENVLRRFPQDLRNEWCISAVKAKIGACPRFPEKQFNFLHPKSNTTSFDLLCRIYLVAYIILYRYISQQLE